MKSTPARGSRMQPDSHRVWLVPASKGPRLAHISPPPPTTKARKSGTADARISHISQDRRPSVFVAIGGLLARASTCTSPAVVAALARGQARCTRAPFGGSPASLRGGRGPNDCVHLPGRL